jgi:hypothetical protein
LIEPGAVFPLPISGSVWGRAFGGEAQCRALHDNKKSDASLERRLPERPNRSDSHDLFLD